MKTLELLRTELKTIADLRAAAAVLQWDQETYMPAGSGRARAEQIALLESLAHRHLTGDRMRGLLSELVNLDTGETRGDLDAETATLIREVWKDYHRAAALPGEFVEEYSRATSLGQQIWAKARRENDFSRFAPQLEKIVDLKYREIEYLGVRTTPYDTLVDYFEPGLTSAEISRLFAELKTRLVPLVLQIAASGVDTGKDLLHRDYDTGKQWEFGLAILKDMGFDFETGRQDQSAHPFTTSFHPTDVRLTTRLNRHDLMSALGSTIHEGGHGLYDQGLDADWYGTPFCEAVSYGIHESQSRLWENLVGRGRPFWRHYYPRLQALFPEHLAEVSLDEYYRAINTVQPSLIRVEADEATYNLHIMLRFEIEQQVINEHLPVSDLPAVWNDKMEAYLGLRPDSDADGVLQDVHWAFGGFGYFPSYALGNFYNVPMYRQAVREIPALEDQIAAGNLRELREWLREKVHRVGRRRTAAELIRDITGEELSAVPFMDYLEEKYRSLYSL